jgi:hypothetical protein
MTRLFLDGISVGICENRNVNNCIDINGLLSGCDDPPGTIAPLFGNISSAASDRTVTGDPVKARQLTQIPF